MISNSMTYFTRLLWAMFLAAILAAGSSIAQGGQKYAKVELISDHSVAVPGNEIWLGLSFEMVDGWHIYWENPGDAGIPPELSWNESAARALGSDTISDFVWPVPELLPVVPGEIMDYGYSGKVILPFQAVVSETAEGPILLDGVADYLICKDICIPERSDVSLLLSLGSEVLVDEAGQQAILDANSTGPEALNGQASLSPQTGLWTLSVADPRLAGLSGDARFFPKGHEIVHAADQAARFGPAGLQIDLTPSASSSIPDSLDGLVVAGDVAIDLSAAPGPILDGTGDGQATASAGAISLPVLILLAIIGGLILNLMPCVLPVLSIKAMGVVASSASGNAAEARAHGLWYTAGVVLSFAALAAAIVSVKAVTPNVTWGFWMQNPMAITVLALIVFLIGLWLLGMFELGQSVQNVGSGLAAKQGSAGAFFTGVLAAVVGAPCTGPFLGAALGAVMARPGTDIFIVLVAMGIGMAFPFLLLSFVPGLQKRMPKPGAWMDTLKQVFAFPMFLTAAWLLSVLGALSGNRIVAIVVAGGALIAFGLWALRELDRGPRTILISALGLLSILPIFGIMGALSGEAVNLAGLARSFGFLVLMIGAIWLINSLSDDRAKLVTRIAAIAVAAIGLTWPVWQLHKVNAATSDAYPTEVWSPERVAELTEEGRSVFIDFTAEWCATCQANKVQTLTKSSVSRAFEDGNVAFLVADFTRGDEAIAAELRKHNRAGVPMYLWYANGATTPEVLPEILSVELVTGLVEETR